MTYRVSDLRNFAKAVPFNTLSEAAKNMGITQPSLSQSIKRLESDLEMTLFYRTKSGVHLTPDGQLTFVQAKKALNALEVIKISAADGGSFSGRNITMGCHPTVGAYTLPKSLSLLKENHPDFNIDIIHGPSRNIQLLVQTGKVDLGIIINPNRVPDIIIKEVAIDKIFIWSKSSNIKKLNKVICNLDLYQTQFILRKWKKMPVEIINSESFELISRLTERELGFGIIPERAVKLTRIELFKHKNLPFYRDSICLVYRPEFGKRPFEKKLISCVKSVFIED